MKQEVYKVTNNENGKIYIGITIQGVASRWSKHCSDARSNSQFPIHNAIRLYGEDNFTVEVIEELEDEEFDQLKEHEKYWIKYYESFDREKGYNLTLGGDGSWGRFHSEETKEKIRQKAKGRKPSEEVRDRMSKSQKQVQRDYSELARISNKKRWSNPDKRKEASINNPNNSPVIQYSRDGEFIKEFRSISEAAREMKGQRQSISKVVTGKHKSAYGYIWRYKDDM